VQLHGELGDVGETEIGHPAEGSRRTAASFPQPDSGGVIFGQPIQGGPDGRGPSDEKRARRQPTPVTKSAETTSR